MAYTPATVLVGGMILVTGTATVLSASGRPASMLGHELQCAVEVAQALDARDAESPERMFRRLAIEFDCGGTTCYETQAAKGVEHVIGEELKTHQATTRSNPRPSHVFKSA